MKDSHEKAAQFHMLAAMHIVPPPSITEKKIM